MKVRRSTTDVLPLCNATNQHNYTHDYAMLCGISTAACVGLHSAAGNLMDADDIPMKLATARSLMAWDVASKTSPADSTSTVTSN